MTQKNNLQRFLSHQKLLLGQTKSELDTTRRITNPTDAEEIAAAKAMSVYSKPAGLHIATITRDPSSSKRAADAEFLETPVRKALGIVDAAYVDIEFEGTHIKFVFGNIDSDGDSFDAQSTEWTEFCHRQKEISL